MLGFVFNLLDVDFAFKLESGALRTRDALDCLRSTLAADGTYYEVFGISIEEFWKICPNGEFFLHSIFKQIIDKWKNRCMKTLSKNLKSSAENHKL